MILTRYPMSSFEFGEEFLDVLPFSLSGILQALADALAGVGASRDVEQALIGFGVLHDYRSLAFHGENYRALALSELFHKIARPATERGQLLNILGNVQHRSYSYSSTFLGAIRKRTRCKEGLVRAAYRREFPSHSCPG